MKKINHFETSLRCDLSDDYVFSSGETYFERLFATVHLWEQTQQVIREQPLRKEQILLCYERQMMEVLQERKDDREPY